MSFTKKLAILEQIYAIYDEFSATLDLACGKNCACCCTNNVTLTTLEAAKILNDLSSDNKTRIISKIRTGMNKRRFQPRLTTNQLAKLCAGGIEPPSDNSEPKGEECSILENDLCPIYPLRPFGCRCLVSIHNCGEKGYAEIDEFVLSVNTVFLQFIEHIDVPGCTGNLIDVLQVLSSEQRRQAYEAGTLRCSNVELIPNQPLQVIMIPPQHRTRIHPILQSLRQVKA